MTTSTFRYRDLIKDYRKVLNQVVDCEIYYTVVFKRGGNDYEILRLSILNSDIDDENMFLKVTSRDFKDNTATYLNFVRYTLSKLIITVHGRPKWVIEPKFGLVKYMLGQLKIASRKDLKNLVINGHMTTLLGGNPVELRREAKSLNKQIKSVKSEKLKADAENQKLSDRLGVMSRELADLRGRYINVCNPQPNPD